MQKLDELGFIRTLATYDDLDGMSRQTNNTYYIQELPPLPERSARRRLYRNTDGSLTDDPEEALP